MGRRKEIVVLEVEFEGGGANIGIWPFWNRLSDKFYSSTSQLGETKVIAYTEKGELIWNEES